MKYHNSKEAALAAGAMFVDEGNFEARATFEPNNGWVCVLRPVKREAFNIVLGGLLDRYDIDLSAWAMRHLRVVPSYHVRAADTDPVPVPRAAAKAEVVTPAWKPGDKLPW